MKRRDQVVISRLRTGYIINRQDNRLTVDHILRDCKETEAERQRANIQNNIWDKGKDEMKQFIEYVTKIGFKKGYRKHERTKRKTNKKIVIRIKINNILKMKKKKRRK
jgi:hypothetical protein